MNAGNDDTRLDFSKISEEQYEEVLEEIRQKLRTEGYSEEQIAWHEAAARAQTG